MTSDRPRCDWCAVERIKRESIRHSNSVLGTKYRELDVPVFHLRLEDRRDVGVGSDMRGKALDGDHRGEEEGDHAVHHRHGCRADRSDEAMFFPRPDKLITAELGAVVEADRDRRLRDFQPVRKGRVELALQSQRAARRQPPNERQRHP